MHTSWMGEVRQGCGGSWDWGGGGAQAGAPSPASCAQCTALARYPLSCLSLPCPHPALPFIHPLLRSAFAGLQNGGATCYMSSVFQQLFMQPIIRWAAAPQSSAGASSLLASLTVSGCHWRCRLVPLDSAHLWN